MEAHRLAASKKNASRAATFVFIDESGFSESSVIRRTWAPRGRTPVLRPKCRSWKRAAAIGALAYTRRGRSRAFLRLHSEEVRTRHVLGFLRHLLRHIRGPIVVLWDGLGAHWARAVRHLECAQPRMTLVRLPAYAPELNPVEGLWAWTKGTALANVCANRLPEVTGRVRRGIRRARRRPAVLWGFLEKAGLFL